MSLAPGQPDMDGDLVVLRAGALRVEIALLPFEVTVWRGERRLVRSPRGSLRMRSSRPLSARCRRQCGDGPPTGCRYRLA